jgi:hypothetical protein
MFLMNYEPIFISMSLTIQEIEGVIRNLCAWFRPIISTTTRDTAAKFGAQVASSTGNRVVAIELENSGIFLFPGKTRISNLDGPDESKFRV